MNASAIERGAAPGFEDVADVQQPGLVITSDGDFCAGGPDLIKYSAAKSLYISQFGNVRKVRAADTQVKYDLLVAGQVSIDDASEFVGVLLQPVHDERRARAGGHRTSVSERVMSKAGIDRGKLFQKVPCRTFAYREVLVVRLVPGLNSGVHDTNAQSHAHKAIEYLELHFGNRELAVVSGYYVAGSGE